MTIDAALRFGAREIGRRDAGLFLSHITGYSRGGLHLKCLEELAENDCELFLEFIRRRQENEPLQYIIGQWEFMGLPLKTDPRALIPRPETELLAEVALEFINSTDSKFESVEPVRVLDLCTGSGCIALAIASLTGESVEITATDISAAVLELARENAEKLGLSERIIFLESDLLEEIPDKKFDAIISNPPYITAREMENLPQSVRGHEPHLALHGGADGLEIYRRLIPQCKNALRDGGALFVEIGPVAVMDLMVAAGFAEINLMRDYAEIERIITGVKPCLTN